MTELPTELLDILDATVQINDLIRLRKHLRARREDFLLGSDTRNRIESDIAEINRVEEVIGAPWDKGETYLVNDEHVEDWARDAAAHKGLVDGEDWPVNWIDWRRAGDELAKEQSKGRVVNIGSATYFLIVSA